ncbi:MAG: transposase domain-containing protein [Planctomycetota bacterium]
MVGIGKELKELERLRQVGDASWWALVHRAIPEDVMEEILDETGTREKRRRKLTAKTMLLFVISLGLFTEECSEQVYAAMTEGLRFLYPGLGGLEPKKGGFAKPDIAWGPSRWWLCSGAAAGR